MINTRTVFPVFFCVLLLLVAQSCEREKDVLTHAARPDLPQEPFPYLSPDFGNVTEFNHQATLGRVLFYERQLSANNSISCGSCHKQAFSFADNVAFSRGLNNQLTHRNSMPVLNLAGSFPGNTFLGGQEIEDGLIQPGFILGGGFFWDGRENSLERLAMLPVRNHIEMGMSNPEQLESKLSHLDYYPELFNKAFGSAEITIERIAKALTAFMSSIQANNSRSDQYLFTNNATLFTATEKRGFDLFFSTYNCAGCHNVFPGTYHSPGFFNIGLDLQVSDLGVGAFFDDPNLQGVFRTPNLKNIELTAPYMHDGRFNTLEEVLDHYSGGIQNAPSLSSLLKDTAGNPIKMQIPESDKIALIAYLRTLTDYSIVADPKFSDPFTIQE